MKILTILNLSIFFATQAYTQSSINFDTVFIGNDENEADTTGYGAVSYDYYIGKYEVTNSEYAAFLNAVAATDTYSLWHQSMSIEQTGLGGDYTYSVVDGKGEHPVVRVNFFDAARFANWLMNGQPTGSQDQTTTESGFYTFSGASTISSQGTRSANKIDDKNWVAIASEDEWYKAAYYDRALNSGAGGYYKYPTGSDTAPIKSAPTVTPNSANYGGKNGVGATTVVGSYSGASSRYGTFDQGGNVQEWTDSIVDESKRAVRGGGYNASKGRALLSTFRYPTNSDIKQLNIGFRISSLSTMSVDAMLSAESGSYGIGDTLLIKAIWNDTVEVTGIPKLKLSNGSEAVYSNGSGTSTLLFSYTLQAGDVSAKDISVEEYTGTIKNASGDLVSQISGDLGSVEIDLKLPDYYVSTSGDDAGLGDFNNPWKTIQHAFETVKSGDTVHVRGGKYHEAITANDLKGSSVSKITFTNYNEEEVIVAGTVQIPTADWSVHTGNIYKKTLTQDIWQLFVDSDMMTTARWPNIKKDWHEPDTSSGYDPTPNSYWDMDSTQARLTENSSWGHFYNDENYQSLSSLNKSIEGAMLVCYRTLVHSNTSFTEQITHHTAGSDNFIHTTINFPADNKASQPASYARYYIEADLDLLDAPGEWFFDKDTRELYVWFKDSGPPAGRHIEGKNKDYILELRNCENLIFNGIQFFAGAFKLNDTYDTIFEDCKFIHSSYGKRMLKVIKPGDGFVIHPFSAAYNATSGSRNPANLTWRDCEFAKYEGVGLYIRTNGGNLVENCYFHNGQITQVVYGAVSDHKGSGTIIRRNTFHTLGEGNATKNGKDGLLEYNRVYNMHFNADSSAFQTPVGAQQSTRLRYNWIHDSYGRNAVRFDGDPAGIRCKVDHIVAMHNQRGFRLKGDQHQIYNLTALGNIPAADITIGIEKFYGYEPADCMEHECRIKGRRGSHQYHANENSIVKNIAANRITTWPLIPVDNAAIWHGNDISQDLTDQLRDPANFDFRPKATSDLVDNGVVIPGFTDVYEGVAPDIGAYEYGDTNYWIPGCKFNKASTPIPPDNAIAVKTDADLMWLEGKNALEHRVYFGTQSGSLPLLGTQTNNIFAPGTLDENTEYFWRIDTVTADGIITGDEWSFTPKKSKPGTAISIFYPTEDTYVDSGNPDMNFGGSLSLNLTTPTIDITREAYIKFNPQVDGDIVAATLRLGSAKDFDFGIYPVADNSWQEDTMTWNPPNSPPLMGDLPIATKPDWNDGWFEADVSTYFTENGTKSIGLVRAPRSNVRGIQSSESATPPELIIEYIIPTSQTNHSPYFHANAFGSTDATANVKYSSDISAEAIDPDLDQMIFSKAAGPSWLIVNPDGTLSGTPLPADVGTNSFTMRVTDPSAEFSDSLMSITVLPVSDVVDTTAPVITLNGDVVVTVEAGTNYSDAGAGALDGYDGDLTESMEVTDGVDILTVGSYTVSYNVSDAAGNAAAPVIRTVIVVDTTPPVIALVGEAIVTIEAGSLYEDAGVQANDTGDGDLSSKIELVSTVNTDKLGEYTVTYTVSDSSGNEAVEVNRVVKVVDTTAPVITLNGDVVVTVEAGTNYSDAGAGAVDGYDGDLTESMEVTDGADILTVGSYTVSYNVSDAAGNAAVPVIRTVIVVDTTPPVIALVGEAIVTIEAGSLYEDAGVQANDTGDGDLSSKIELVSTVNTDKLGEYTVTYTVSDSSGNEAVEVNRVVKVVDTTAPVITLNGDVVVTVEAGTNYSDAGAGAVDGYDGDLTESMEVTDGADILTVGSYTVSYNVSDAVGNAAAPVIRTVIVVDTTPPVIALVGEAIVTIEAGSIYEDAGVQANDTGDGDLSSKIELVSTVNTDKLGEYTVTYTVSDSSGNEAVEVNRVVKVVDTTAPVITLNGDVVVTVEAGTNYSDAGAGALDGYDGDLTESMEVTDGVDILTVGSYTVSYNVSDAAGNAAAPVIRTVIVVDTTPPVIALVGEAIVTIEAGSIYEDAGVQANDTGDGDLSSKIELVSTVNTDKLGEYTVTYTVSDSSGNEAVEVNRVVKVVDTTAPVITLNGDVVVTVEAGTNYSDAGAGALDGYDGDLTESMEVTDGVDILTVGSYTVSYNVSDAAGNAAAPVIRTVIVVDTTPPVIALVGEAIVTIEAGSLYEDAGVQANDTGDGDLSSKIELVSTVNTDKLGEYTVTYTVSDSSGNEAVEVNRVVKVVDTTAPVITLNGDVVVTVEAGTNYSDAGAGALDGYDGDLTESMEVTDGVDILTVGSYTVSYNVSDAAGNAAAPVIRTVIVVDTTPPVIALVGEAIVTIEAGSIYEDAGAVANDSVDGDLTSKVKVAGKVDVQKVGEYQLKYNVEDASGNKSLELTRRVIVETSIKETIRIEKYNSVPFWFEFKSKKEKSYAIESSTDLREWKGINVIKGTGAIIRFEDERDQVFLQMYYRVRMID